MNSEKNNPPSTSQERKGLDESSPLNVQISSLLSAIVDSSDDAIISKTLDGTITSWNQSAERLFGYTAQEAIGRNISLIIPPDRLEEEPKIIEKLKRGERVDHFETVRARKDGSTLDISLTISPVKDGEGRVVGASKVARDITTRKQAEDALRASEERFRELSRTLDAVVSLRTSELEQRNADVLEGAERLRDLTRRMMQIQDDERRRLARELHDSSGQLLAVLNMKIAQLAESVRPELTRDAKEAEELVQQLTKEIRTTSYLLHPPLLDEIGLTGALSWYVQGLIERSRLDIRLHIGDDLGRLSPDLELVIFRLVQECLTNVHRHSGSKSAIINIERKNKSVHLEVQDQGKGIAPEKLAQIQSQAVGVGIRGMRERVRQFGGDLKIKSNEAGTTIEVTIPILPTPRSSEKETRRPLQDAS